MRALYRRRAAAYDRVTRMYRLFGFDDRRYRARATQALNLNQGATVVDLGCGTGLNFEYLVAQVGPGGRVVGVDVADAMLAQARRRIDAAGWDNVELVEADAATYRFPEGVDAVLSTLAMSLSEDYQTVIERAASALRPYGSMAILDVKYPERWPRWLVQLGVTLNRGYGISLDLRRRTPWTSVRACLSERTYEEFFGGSLYLLGASAESGATTELVSTEKAQATSGA